MHYKNDSIALVYSCLADSRCSLGTLGILDTFMDTSVLVIRVSKKCYLGPHRNILYRELVCTIFLGPQKQSMGAQIQAGALKRVTPYNVAVYT
jgi:hypothetical protein